MEADDDNSLKEKVESCKHFLVDSEMDNAGQRAFNFTMNNLDPNCFFEKLDTAFDNIKCAAKLKIACAIVVKYSEKGSSR